MRHGDELERLAQKIEKPRERYLKWAQVVRRYDRGRKTKFAQVLLRLRAVGGKKSVAMLEHEAWADPEMVEYLKELNNAEEEMTKAEVEFFNMKTNLDAYDKALSWDQTMARVGGG